MKGYWENGNLIDRWNCPDDRSFPPIELKDWNKVPVVNERFPTYEETVKGISIHHYGEKKSSDIRPYKMTLPKLAYLMRPDVSYFIRPESQSPFEAAGDTLRVTDKSGLLVIVIQVVQTAKDTIVGYRYFTGGVGGSVYRDFHFLSEAEVEKTIGH